MRLVNRILALFVVLALGSAAWAAEIVVTPGTGTLAAAIAAASDGDTLVLQDGGYYGDVTVGKSLTIRPLNRSTDAVLGGGVTIQGDAIDVTVQGLTFTTNIVLNSAAAVRILENLWTSGGIVYGLSGTANQLIAVGNRLNKGSIGPVQTEGAYVAGNTLTNGQIYSGASAWIVGNDVSYPSQAIVAAGSAAVSRIIGNRLYCNSSSSVNCIYFSAGQGVLANNIVTLTPSTSYSWPRVAIRVNGSGYASLVNNITQATPGDVSSTGISVETPLGRVTGNIFVGHGAAVSVGIYSTADSTYNLCYNVSGGCPEGDGNLNVDPQFVDLVDFNLAATSPAIDAGPPDYTLADLDRTRNDMGVYGGPWSIGQYDVQRDPYNLTPYVYPRFKGDVGYSGGVLDVQAIGVARLR